MSRLLAKNIMQDLPFVVLACLLRPKLRSAFIVAALLLVTPFGRGDLFVAPGGSDADAGTESKPLATLEAAREAVRKLKQGGELPAGGLTVWLRSGDYERSNVFELTTADSGSPGAPIAWRSYSGERARLLGGRTLTGFKPVTDPAVTARLDEKARGHVLQVDLRVLGITDFGEMKSRGFGRPTATSHCELFYQNRPMTLARWPNEGEFAQIAGYPASSDRKDEHGGKLGELPGGFLYDGDRPRRWQDTSELWVHGYWAYDWANSYEKVASLDVEQRLVKTAPPRGHYGFRKGQRFYFLNLLEELDQPGEWYLERKTGLLYFWPPDGAAAAEKNTLLSLLGKPLIRLSGASHVIVRGLLLEATRGNAVEIRGGASNRIAGCLIRNAGDSGVVIDGGTGHGVVGCDVFDTGDGGVSLTGGDRKTLAPGGHFVENCHFQRQGRWLKC